MAVLPDKQRTFGQFETPPDVADLLLGFCLRRPFDRLLDPGCGAGAFLQRAARWQGWMASSPADVPPETLWGVELDPETAAIAHRRLPQAHILAQNFFTLQPGPIRPFDAVIGNPPYTRASWLGHLSREAETPAAQGEAHAGQPVVPPELGQRLSGRSGLYAYFFLHSLRFLREGGRLGFVVPNGWLDVAYGEGLKQLLLDHFKIVALIESGVERWFRQAEIKTCLIVLEKCSDSQQRTANLTRLVRLKRPLRQLIPRPPDDYRRPQVVERLVARLLAGRDHQTDAFAVRVQPQKTLEAAGKWGMALRAPAVYQLCLQQATIPSLKNWATVQRGFTTGANAFFYLTPEVIARWGIEPRFRRPVLKSLRGLHQLQLDPAVCHYQVLQVPPAAGLSGTAVADYIAWGEAQGYHLRRTCAARRSWYSLLPQSPAQLVLPKGIWRHHLAPLLEGAVLIDQQLYQVRPADGVPLLAAAALLNSAWFALQCELQGRTNFGGGVLWLAGYELEQLLLPDPRALAAAQVAELERFFERLAQRPVLSIEKELAQPDRQALNTAVFALLGFSQGEQTAVLESLLERVRTRRQRAQRK